MTKKIFWCNNCLNMSTRPRITFDQRGWCNACQWMEEKKEMDWSARKKELQDLLDKHRSTDGSYDCLVPASGGKDGSYLAYQLKHKYKMNPLAVTSRPPLSLELGDKNLEAFIGSGYEHIHVSANLDAMRKLNKLGFIEKGFPYYGWLITITTVPLIVANRFNIPLIFWGEEGEVEYGGSTELKNKGIFNIEFIKKVYLESGYEKILKQMKFNKSELYWFKMPAQESVDSKNIQMAKWSYFEPWDSYRNYLIAKEYCGLKESGNSNSGTFTNFAQNDQALYSLHAYMMYLKFGFGRATQDAGIEIRRGSMTRDQAINLVQIYENAYPNEFINTYLDYYGMTKEEFDSVLDRHVNKNLFEKIEGIWCPKFKIGEAFTE
jgi:N-acetyl sugar amidotransferase